MQASIIRQAAVQIAIILALIVAMLTASGGVLASPPTPGFTECEPSGCSVSVEREPAVVQAADGMTAGSALGPYLVP